MQQIESQPPLETVIIAATRPMVIATTALAEAVRLEFSTPSVRGQPVVTGLTTASAGSTRTVSESTCSFGSGSVFSSKDLLCDVDAQDEIPIKKRRTSSSDSVSTLGFGMATFSSQDLMYLDYTTSKNESENAQAKTIDAALSCKRDSYL